MAALQEQVEVKILVLGPCRESVSEIRAAVDDNLVLVVDDAVAILVDKIDITCDRIGLGGVCHGLLVGLIDAVGFKAPERGDGQSDVRDGQSRPNRTRCP